MDEPARLPPDTGEGRLPAGDKDAVGVAVEVAARSVGHPAEQHFDILVTDALLTAPARVRAERPDDAWCVELSEAVPAPAAWAEIPYAETHLPGAAFVVAVIPDEDPDLERTVHIHGHDEHVIPYEIMRWFMEQVAEQVERCRVAFEQGGRETVN